MPKTWIVGQKGGPAGQFHTVLEQSGRIIAFVPDKDVANKIAAMPNAENDIEFIDKILLHLEGASEDWTRLEMVQKMLEDWKHELEAASTR